VDPRASLEAVAADWRKRKKGRGVMVTDSYLLGSELKCWSSDRVQ